MADDEYSNDATFECFRPALMLLARSQLGPRFRRVLDDSDIVQQTLLEAHSQNRALRGKTTTECFAWLRKILTNTILDAVRTYTRQKRSVDRELNFEDAIRGSAMKAERWLTDRHSSPSQRAERNEQLQQLARALLLLPDAQREAIELFHLQGCSLKDVAQQLDRSGPAVAGLIHRGLKQLRELMPSEKSLSVISIDLFRSSEAPEHL
jgi:RNA polymerase sigma-70 factor (ECF subfamily)